MAENDEVDRPTSDAVGKVTEAFETVERARGHLYAFHQMTGSADLLFEDAAKMLRDAGHAGWADRIDDELIGLNVLPERWTFQVVEEYDDGYYRTTRELTRQVREGLTGGRRHAQEQRMKDERRTRGRPGHEAGPPSTPPS
ncbi:hypothetical protein Amsp01_045340 [Amycolatopsis sp. NBRC 101858]|uniref:hypothetical protein n=1 Tax=Amycolatopsis sp. NBRC 101858 TaxID=3032200 RepID=UPI0024A15166|nr:hypothetical protein [Amycolatopsis sp. NBRC 101858]GLY38510.1 hypothetical protein Amsp01_045340 [Amycolatopsis sp. NBRC 101858]